MTPNDSEPPLTAAAPRQAAADADTSPGGAAPAGGALRGRRVLVMRPAAQIQATAALLRAQGADPIALPSIAIVPPPDRAPVERAVTELSSYDVVVFTSENAVDALWGAIEEQGRDARAFGRARLAAIGRSTADALRSRGLAVDIMPERFVAEALGAAILAALGEGAPRARVLLPRALEAREALPEMLRAAGVQVDVAPVYQTIAASAERADELRRLLERRQIDYVLLCSSSTVTNLCAMLGTDAVPLLSGTRLASIGPITTETAERLGLHVALTALPSTIESLVQAVATDAAGADAKVHP